MKPLEGKEKGQQKWKSFDVERGSSMAYRKEFQTSKKSTYILENYKGKNPMSRSQWRREQRRRKAQREAESKENGESSTNIPVGSNGREKTKFVEKLPVGRKLFVSQEEEAKEKHDRAIAEGEMMTDNFDSGSEASLDIIVNVVSVLPREFDQIT